MDHDHSYKLLFSHREMVTDLLQGFVSAEWVRAVDFTTLERVHSSHISTDLRERDDDILWRVRWQHSWLYVYLLLSNSRKGEIPSIHRSLPVSFS